MRKIKASTLVPGNSYHFALYSNRNDIMPCKLVSRPETQIGLMEKDDIFIIEKEDGTKIEFRRNNCEPYFLITDVPGKREGSAIQERVVFFGEDLPPKVAGKRGRKPKDKVDEVSGTEDVNSVVEESLPIETTSEPEIAEEQEEFDPKLIPQGGLRISYYSAHKNGDVEKMKEIREKAGV